jgi:hypothetical protein
MSTFFVPVALPERCYLEEVLYWVAFQRLPVAVYYDGEEIRQSAEMEYAPDIVETELTEVETKWAGIPPDPRWLARLDERTFSSSSWYDDLLAKHDLDPKHRTRLSAERDAAVAFEKEYRLWRPDYERAIEYPCSIIYIALREGRLAAMGRPLPALDEIAAIDQLEAKHESVLDVEATNIPSSFWTLKGIDFERSAAKSADAHYCHISILTDDMLTIFPGDREEVSGVERVGESFVSGERPDPYRPRLHRGRPPYAWDAFHLEVTDLLLRHEMPTKKEAAIEHFERQHGTRPSRAAVGEKLKPYFDRFIKSGRQKT